MRSAPAPLILLLVLSLAAESLAAPEPGVKPLPEQRPVNEFLPYSYLQFVPFKRFQNIEPGNNYAANAVLPYYFEGAIAPNLIIYESQTRVLMDSAQKDRTRFASDVSITPQIEMRLYRTPSLPVRHPSFKPQITGNFTFYFPTYEDGNPKGVHKLNLQAKAQHYSNGAEGCLFQEDTAAVEFENGEWRKVCRENDGSTINNLDGEFTSTFLAVGAYYHYSWLGREGLERQALRTSVNVELQPSWMRLPGASVPTQRGVYNPDLKTTGALALYSRTYGALGGFKYYGRVVGDYFPMIAHSNRANRAPYVTPYGVGAQLGWLPDNDKFLRGWAFYVGGYHGQDPYNIEFRHRVTQAHIGFISTSSLQFRMR
jgi:hypothetical protein